MKIKAISVFLDDTDRFEIDDQRTVSDERGAYFVANGWAIDMDGCVATGGSEVATDLNINNSGIALGDSNG